MLPAGKVSSVLLLLYSDDGSFLTFHLAPAGPVLWTNLDLAAKKLLIPISLSSKT